MTVFLSPRAIAAREEAKTANLKHYFSGEPCKHGHVCKRYLSTNGCLECVKVWVARRADKKKIGNAEYRAANRAKLAAAARARYKLKTIEIKAKQARYFEKHKDIINARRRANREVENLAIRNRNAKKHGNGGKHSVADILAILEMQGHKCAYCRRKLDKTRHVDHVTPIKLGGSNSRENLQLLCPKCNLSKSAKDPIIFAQSIGRLL